MLAENPEASIDKKGNGLDILGSYKDKCQYLSISSLTKKYRGRQMADKSFSNLIAERLGFRPLPGFILLVKNRRIRNCLAITKDTKITNFKKHQTFYVGYDFRLTMRNLQSWLLHISQRPKGFLCKGIDVEARMGEAIIQGSTYSDVFYLIVRSSPDSSLKGLATLDCKGRVYIEIRNNQLDHRGESTDYVINNRGKVVQMFPITQGQKKVPEDMLKKLAQPSRKLFCLMREDIVIEWASDGEDIFLHSAQCSSKYSFPYISAEPKRCRTNVQVVSPGKCTGKIMKISDLHETLGALRKIGSLETRCIFMSANMDTNLAILLPYAKGFIFGKGNILCHLAILLRELGIPSLIVEGTLNRLRSGDNVNLDATHARIEVLRFKESG